MKKIVICLLTTFLTFTFIPNDAKAETVPVQKEIPVTNALPKEVLDKMKEFQLSEKPLLKDITRKNAKEKSAKPTPHEVFSSN